MSKEEKKVYVDPVDGSESSYPLSQKTLDTFKMLNEQYEEGEEVSNEDETTPKLRDVRKDDEGLNEDGTVVMEDDEEEEEKEKEEKKEVVEKKQEEDDKKDSIELPDRLIQAAYRNHLTDSDILALGDRAESVLSAMADNSDKISTELGELGRLRKKMLLDEKPPEKKKEDIRDDDDDYDEPGWAKKLRERIEGFEKREQTRMQDEQTRLMSERDMRIDKFFDKRSETLPTLGKDADKLTQIELALRKQIYSVAEDIELGSRVKGTPLSLEDALERAVSIHEKEYIKEATRKEIVDKVKEREKQQTSRPTQRRTVKTYDTPEKAAEDKVKKWWEAHGGFEESFEE